MPMLADIVDGVIGVDTHRDTLAAAATTPIGRILAQTATSADAAGYRALLDFADAQIPDRRCWAVEGPAAMALVWRWIDHLPARPLRAGR
jgi:transposase